MKHSAMLIAALLAAGTVQAQSNHSLMPEGSRAISLSLAAVWQQHPNGNEQARGALVPLLSARWANGVFVDMNTIGMELSEQPGMEYGPLLSPLTTTMSSLPGDAHRRRFTPQVGGYFNFQLSDAVRLISTLKYGGSSDRRGVNLELGADAGTLIAPHHNVGMGVSVKLSNRSALQADFGADNYVPAAGWSEAGVNLHWHWEMTTRTRWSTYLVHQRYLGGAAASPRITHAGGNAVLTMATYRF